MKYYLIFLAFFSQLVLAQPKVVFTWKEEPTSVLQQKLGEPIALPTCSKDLSYGETCANLVLQNEDRSVYEIKHPARLGIAYSAQIYTRRSRVTHVILSTDAQNQVAFYRLIIQRYGFPHQQKTFGNSTGASHRNLVWFGKESKMRFVESLSYAQAPLSMVTWASKREEFDVNLQSSSPKRATKPAPVQAPRVITGPGF